MQISVKLPPDIQEGLSDLLQLFPIANRHKLVLAALRAGIKVLKDHPARLQSEPSPVSPSDVENHPGIPSITENHPGIPSITEGYPVSLNITENHPGIPSDVENHPGIPSIPKHPPTSPRDTDEPVEIEYPDVPDVVTTEEAPVSRARAALMAALRADIANPAPVIPERRETYEDAPEEPPAATTGVIRITAVETVYEPPQEDDVIEPEPTRPESDNIEDWLSQVDDF